MPGESSGASFMQLKGMVAKNSKLFGLVLSGDALQYLTELIEGLSENDRNTVLEKIWTEIARRKYGSGSISKAQCEDVCKEFTSNNMAKVQNFSVYGAFDLPRFIYDNKRHTYIRKEPLLLTDDSAAKCDLYKNRYLSIYQRLLRNPLFDVRSTATTLNNKQKYKLKSIETLYGVNITMENITLFGLLTQLKIGIWYIEDMTGAMKLNLKQSKFSSGLMYEGCYVLCEGTYKDEELIVTGMSLPPAESAKISRSFIGDINMFGGDSGTYASNNDLLKQREKSLTGSFIVFLSHVTLDNPQVLAQLNILFCGYSEFSPVAFVMCGPFLEKPQYDSRRQLSECFQELAELIKSFSGLEKTRFVFVPSDLDDGFLGTYPRPPIRSVVTKSFTNTIKNCEFTTNPCRLQFCTKEIVVFREDLIRKSFGCRIHDPETDSSSLTSQFVESIASQSSLAVLPLPRLPVLWTYEHTLSLYPFPDLCVIADSHHSFIEKSNNSTFISPGVFPQSNFSFKVYYPITNEIEDCEITADMQASVTNG